MQLDHHDVTAPPATAQAGRPRFALTDEQARSLVQQLDAIETRHANNLRQHRPFVHDFVRAVYHATGKTYSAGIYRKLLNAYAPGRTPSTPTIEVEKNLLERDLQHRAVPREIIDADTLASRSSTALSAAAPAAPSPGEATNVAQHQILGLLDQLAARLDQAAAAPNAKGVDLAAVQTIGLLQHLTARVEQLVLTAGTVAPAPGVQAHNDYLQERLATVEQDLAEARTLAARMTASAQEEASVAAERGRQLVALQATSQAQTEALSKMAASIDGDRQFFAMQVDGVRGETRAVREQLEAVKARNKDLEQQAEMYRRMAFSKGAGQ
jgi:hypothetical protein